MKKLIRMKRRFCIFCVALMLVGMLGIPMHIHAENTVLTYPLYHKHIADCETMVYETVSADISTSLRTVKTDTCACGGHHDYYDFTASCSCGRTWHTTGHACINSPAGSFPGSCQNYAYIDCNTSHRHQVIGYDCGKTEETIIDVVRVEASTLLPTKEVTLNAISEGILDDVVLEWEKSGFAQMKVEENGVYHLFASYVENQIQYMSNIVVEINNIDVAPPNVSEIIADITEYTSGNIILLIEATDEGGLSEDYVSWNGNVFGKDNYFEIGENGTYEAVVRDIAGNTVVRTITIENIDKEAPVISLIEPNPKPWYSENCQVKIWAEDALSGLPEEAYSWDKGESWTSQNWIEVCEDSTVEIWIRDNAGNVLNHEIEIIRQNRPASNNEWRNEIIGEEGSFIANQEMTEQIVEANRTVEEVKVSFEVSENKLKYQFLPEPDWSSDIKETYIEAEPLYSENATDKLELLRQDGSAHGWGVVLPVSFVMGLSLVALLLCLYLFFGICRIYEIDNRQKEKYLGNTGIRFVKNGYSAKIGENIINKANSRILKLKLPEWFVKLAEYKPLKIIVGEYVLNKYVEKEVDFNIKD